MNEEITDERLIELIEGNPDEELQRRLDSDNALKARYDALMTIIDSMERATQYDVPANVRMNVELALEKEIHLENNSWPWMQVAAAVGILLLGFSLGKWSDGENTSSSALIALRNEIQDLRETTLANTLQQHSASERILAVNQIEEKHEINKELLGALITTLNSDESPNVRYAALQALGKFIEDHKVRAELVKSLESQTDALIQISLINLLVDSQERSAIAPLKELIQNEEVTPEVRSQAEIALKVLS